VLQHGDLYAITASLATFRLSSTSWSLALSREQAAQSRAFHKIVSGASPGVISSADLVLGGLRAEGNAWARRLVYLMLRRRLRPGPSSG
jgi:hypothetical protein